MTEGVRAPSYTWQWMVTLLLLVGAITFHFWNGARLRKPVPLQLPSDTERAQVDWFQIVRLPELPSDREAAKRRVEELRAWLCLLEDHGIANLTLSDAISRLSGGALMPEGSVVLLYDPGYRYTYEAATPLLGELGARVVWLTDDPGIHTTDRRFVTRHDRRLLDENGMWDSGLRVGDGFSFVLEEDSAARAGHSLMQWARPNGAYGINRLDTLDALERMNANPRWSPEEFLARLMAEWPVRRPTDLTAALIEGRLWGTRQGLDSDGDCAFDFTCPPDRRDATVSWPGTRGLSDCDVELEVGELFGELWLLLRSDREAGRRVRVGFTPDGVRVQVEEGTHNRELAFLKDPSVCSDGIHLRVTLHGGTLTVETVGDGRELLSVPVEVVCSSVAIMEMTLYDRITGAARASDVRVHVTPGAAL